MLIPLHSLVKMVKDKSFWTKDFDERQQLGHGQGLESRARARDRARPEEAGD